MDQRFVDANAALKAGDYGKAVDLIVAALKDDPNQPANTYRIALLNMHRLDRFDEADVWSVEGTKRHPRNFDLWNIRGVVLRRLGRLPEAIKVFDQALKISPGNTSALMNKGNVLNDQENGPAAEVIFSKLVRQDPRSAEYQRALGRAMLSQKKLDQAAIRFRQAVSLKKDFLDAWLDLTSVENRRHNYAEADASMDRALEAMPDHPRLLEARVILMRRSGRIQDALAYLETLVQRLPDQGWIHYQMGGCIADNDRAKANIHFRRAVELTPDKVEYVLALAESYERSRHGNEGENIEQAYQALKPILPLKRITGTSAKVSCEILVRVGEYEMAETMMPYGEMAQMWAREDKHTALLKHLARVKTHQDRLDMVAAHRAWGKIHEEEARRTPITHPKGPRPSSKIRLGFLSSDLRNHPVAYFAMPLFEHIDHERFEVYCYSFNTGKEDGTQKRLRELVTAFRLEPDITDRDAAQMIANDQLDILWELGGSTHMNKIGVMAYKPARLSGSWLGYPHSSGLDLDYLLVDPYLKPPAKEMLIEEPLEMPKTWIGLGRQAFPDGHVINPVPPMQRHGVVTFGTANNPYKYSRETLTIWAQVVAAVPNSRFLFVRPEGSGATFCKNIRAIFAEAGVSEDRVLFNPVRGAHMPFYNEIDVALDTFPQTGGTTTCEALWMGVPTVAMVGEALFERLSYSILHNAGLPDLIANSPEEFVAIAVKLANDPERVADIRVNQRDRLKASPLGQTDAFAKDFYDLMARTVESRLGARQRA